MAGSSCQNCIFAQYEGQGQNGCTLGRLDKYETATIINDDYTGSYRVTISNLCPAKRTKSWLSKNPRQPELTVRKELYPKIQLLVIVDEYTEEWAEFFERTSFNKYSVVDVLLFKPNVEVRKYFYAERFFLHECYPVNNPLLDDVKYQINYLVRDDCQFYLTVDDPQNARVSDWPEKLDNYLNDLCKSLYMTYDFCNDCIELPYNNRLVYTPLHFSLCGYGSQSIGDKISIYCSNHDQHDLIKEIDEVWIEPTN